AAALVPSVLAHTWVEQLRNIDDNGDYVGEYGYPRGFMAKTDPGYNGDSDNYLNPPLEQQPPFINSTNLLCHPSQRTRNQTKWPRLQTSPGTFIAMRYMENGHITLPDQQVGKPEKAGTIYVFGTQNPKDNERIADVLQWTEDGNGGNKNGILVGKANYDDGRCYEINEHSISTSRQAKFPNYAVGQAPAAGAATAHAPGGGYPFFCETNVAIPKDAKTGQPYTLYWVWQWPSKAGSPNYPKGKDEYYSTCIDVDVADTFKADLGRLEFPLGQQDANSKAVSDYKSRTALATDPIKGELGPLFSGGKSNNGPTATGVVPIPSGSAPQPSPTSLQSSAGAPTGSVEIPQMTQRPGAPSPPAHQPNQPGIVTLTVTQRVTVTA
ncbi:hypothetical protein BDV96DRAFT_473328, partial [Lophiotrema nucula]